MQTARLKLKESNKGSRRPVFFSETKPDTEEEQIVVRPEVPPWENIFPFESAVGRRSFFSWESSVSPGHDSLWRFSHRENKSRRQVATMLSGRWKSTWRSGTGRWWGFGSSSRLWRLMCGKPGCESFPRKQPAGFIPTFAPKLSWKAGQAGWRTPTVLPYQPRPTTPKGCPLFPSSF